MLLLLLGRFSHVRLCATHRHQPTRLPRPWDSPGKNTGGVAISFSNAWKWKVKVKSLSHVRLFETPWTAAHQPPSSMGFSRQKYWSGVPLPSPLRPHSTWQFKGRLFSKDRLLVLNLHGLHPISLLPTYIPGHPQTSPIEVLIHLTFDWEHFI